MDDENIKTEFDRRVEIYIRLAKELKGLIGEFLTKKNIRFIDVVYRIKKFDSFKEKINRKNYGDQVFDQMIDICGIRIIYRYNSDLQKIVKEMNSEFIIEESENKVEATDVDRFGYRSHHLVARIRDDWLSAPQFRESRGLRFEIQIQSLLMHSWADISHQLFYKKDLSDPHAKRKLFRLSALLEIADIELDSLLPDTIEEDDLQIDELQRVLDEYFPDRVRSERAILAELLSELHQYGLSVGQVEEAIVGQKANILALEGKVFAESANIPGVEQRWMQVGVARTAMHLTSDTYWRMDGMAYGDVFVDAVEQIRKKAEGAKI